MVNLSIIDMINSSINITLEHQKCYAPCTLPDFSVLLLLIFIATTISHFEINDIVAEKLEISKDERNRLRYRILKHDFWIGFAWLISGLYLLLNLFYGP